MMMTMMRRRSCGSNKRALLMAALVIASSLMVLHDIIMMQWDSSSDNGNRKEEGMMMMMRRRRPAYKYNSIWGAMAMPSCLESVASLADSCLPSLLNSDRHSAMEVCCGDLTNAAQSCACTFMAIFSIPVVHDRLTLRLSPVCQMHISLQTACGGGSNNGTTSTLPATTNNATSLHAAGVAPSPSLA